MTHRRHDAPPPPPAHGPGGLHVAVIGAGWAGMAAAMQAQRMGWRVTVFEAARQVGGRARSVPLALPDGRETLVDNGQHILIGAYAQSLRLMREAGVNPDEALLRLPLTLAWADGGGLRLPARLPAPLDAVWGIAHARGWSWAERLALLRRAAAWQRAGFACDAHASVADICRGLPARLLAEFIEPLCVSALNTPMPQASAQVFLRVLRDAMFGQRNGSNLLLPRLDLGALFAQAAARHIESQGACVRLGCRADGLHWQGAGWRVLTQHTQPTHGNTRGNTRGSDRGMPAQANTDNEMDTGMAAQAGEGAPAADGHAPEGNGGLFDRVVLATSAPHAAAIAQNATGVDAATAAKLHQWAAVAAALPHRAITTVYAQHGENTTPADHWPAPMLALRTSAHEPAQFVFDRDAIAQPPPQGTDTRTRLLAFVISDSAGTRQSLQDAVAAQARRQLGLATTPLLTVTEKRATFACLPALARPGTHIAHGLLACGDYVDGPYPATLEGAAISGLQAAQALQG